MPHRIGRTADNQTTLLKALKRTLQEMIGTDRWYGTMPKVCVIAWIMKTTDPEEVIDTEEMEVKKKKKKEMKRERKRKKEQKRKERNAKLRRRTEARAIANRQAEYEDYAKEAEYYLEECAAFEEQYDAEQCACAYYHRNYIEEALNDIRKRLYQRSQPARTLRHSRWENRKWSYEGSKRKNKRRRPRSSFTRRSNSRSKRSRTTRRGRRSRNPIILLNGSANGWH